MINAFGAEPEGGAAGRRARGEALWTFCLDGIGGRTG